MVKIVTTKVFRLSLRNISRFARERSTAGDCVIETVGFQRLRADAALDEGRSLGRSADGTATGLGAASNPLDQLASQRRDEACNVHSCHGLDPTGCSQRFEILRRWAVAIAAHMVAERFDEVFARKLNRGVA